MSAASPRVLLDQGGHGRPELAVYGDPIAVVAAYRPHEVRPALDALAAQLARGRHAAGYFSYELGYVLEPTLAPLLWPVRPVPLLWFGIFETPRHVSGADIDGVLDGPGRAYAGPFCDEWDAAAHKLRFERIREWIAAGDIYQANLSFRRRFPFVGDSLALYAALRARAGAPYCAYIDDGTRRILSLSPELFFALSPDGRIVCRPMKGTAARGAGDGDIAARARLAASVKDRAENLMIVDLVRNDLGRIAEIGSVRASSLFAIETYPSVHQMVSTVEARVKAGTSIAHILHALFPCGSVTGAPKIRAMEIVREMETSPRGVYCGAIGAFAPDGSAQFNVAIRTLTIAGDRGELGVGGAIVHDSRAASEYDECLLKSRFFESARKPIGLIETLRFSPENGFVRLDLHLARLARSAQVFGIALARESVTDALAAAVADARHDRRVRLMLSEDGEIACESVPFTAAAPEFWHYALSDLVSSQDDVLLRHKTNWRAFYDDEHARAARESGADEVVFRNARGELTEGSRSNLFARIGGQLVTPPLDAGVLDGCLRRALIEDGRCREGNLHPEDLARAEAVYLGNSLRGLIKALPVSRLPR